MEGYVAILYHGYLYLLVFFFINKIEKHKYNAIIEVSKNIDDPSKIEEIIDSLNDKKKPIDYRRSGVITLFIGVGLFLFGLFFMSCKVLVFWLLQLVLVQ